MKLSIIIPAYNEGDVIATTIRTVQGHSNVEVDEIIVVDGGSTDQTIAHAERAGALAIVSPKKGRAAQMNYGAKQAKGDILYFLHADSTPPKNFIQKIKVAVSSGSAAGCFRLTFDEDHPLLNFYAWFTRFDVDAFRYGDQSLYVKQSVFAEVGGFREDHTVMEDNEIVRRLKERYPFSILEDDLETSARTYREVGVIKLQFVFLLIYTLYFLGVEQQTLNHIRKNVIK